MRLFLLSVFSLFWSGLALAAPVKWDANGHYYEFVNTRVTYHEASAAAASSMFEGVTGHLVTITSEAERLFLDALNPRDRDIWLAASDRHPRRRDSHPSSSNSANRCWAIASSSSLSFGEHRSGRNPGHCGQASNN